MAWKVEISSLAIKNLSQLDPQIARRVMVFLLNRVALSDSPRNIGAALQGSELGEFWKYRVGDYRVIVQILDIEVKILVVKIGNRKEVYR
jgi:mRNA interferase RelE/StbE